MSEFEQPDDEASVTEQAPEPSVPQPGPPRDDDFDAALKEYDAATKASEPEAEAEIEDPLDLAIRISAIRASVCWRQ